MDSHTGSRHGTGIAGKALRTALVLLMAGLGIVASVARPPSLLQRASSAGTITVCPAGPPSCEYGTIQAGIDAAGPGDTVLVHPGEYVEQVELRSGIEVSSTAGVDPTVVTHSEGPIVTATSVAETSLKGLTIRGQDIISPAIGVELVDSELVVTDCAIENIVAAYGQDAWGVVATGGTLSIARVVILDILGGDGSYVPGPPCEHFGGAAVGIRSDGADVTISDSELENVRGGKGCRIEGSYTDIMNAGDATGVWASSGAVAIRNSSITGVYAQSARPVADADGQSADEYPRADALRTSATSEILVESSSIELTSHQGGRFYDVMAPLAPGPPGYCMHATGISSEMDSVLVVSDTVILDTVALGSGGSAAGIRTADTDHITITESLVARVEGGINSASFGIDVARAQTAVISANSLSDLNGYEWLPYFFFFSIPGGDISGIRLQDTTDALVINNVVSSLRGGNGSGNARGGYAYAVATYGGAAALYYNTLWDTSGGRSTPWEPPGVGNPSLSAGLYFTGTHLVAANNAIISHTVGISGTYAHATVMAHNDLWHNDVDYGPGVAPGYGDLHVDPAFIDPENGDFHLLPFSPVIDAGAMFPGVLRDFEGDPRPVDGNGDSVALPDIGADEYVPWYYGCTLPLVLHAGP